ncbi:hypothetical protein [Herbaspirillum rubrisubalbicans]|uniref:Uncharacterized protein n=1 Tax=Herbaspirillum rubrisubalbicans TaxID=80842 RepID=A0AAD0UAP3_9BURK|nr:hypothetical protein [Herbaspirillum rubrisubalbicans]AYR25336.1 hypothetical protein RC54_16580 [Herbaspirillum rubrisubalbicans]
MPNVTIFIHQDRMPGAECLERLSASCEQLCTEILEALPENVHIVYVAVSHGKGHPAWADIRYRMSPHRTPAVMDDFMQQLDAAIQACTGLMPRIRCFAYAAQAISARH